MASGPNRFRPIVRNDRHVLYRPAALGRDRFAVVRGYNVHYVDAGDGPPIVLIPGAFSTYRVFNRVVPALAGTFRTIAVDYLGTGDSDKPVNGFRYSVDEQADIVAGLVEALGLSRPLLFGVSYGSAIALKIASRHPDVPGKIACIEGGVLVEPEVLNYSRMSAALGLPFFGDALMGVMKSGLFDRMVSKTIMGEAWGRLSPRECAEIVEIQSSYLGTTSRTAMYRIYRAITTLIDFTAEMGNVRAPVLFLYGESSRYRAVAEANVRFFLERRYNVEILRLKAGIHDLQLQYPRTVAKIVLDFAAAGPQPSPAAGASVREIRAEE